MCKFDRTDETEHMCGGSGGEHYTRRRGDHREEDAGLKGLATVAWEATTTGGTGMA